MTSTTSQPAPPPDTTVIASSSSSSTTANLTPTQAATLRLNTIQHLLHGTSSSPTSAGTNPAVLVRLSSALSSLTSLASSNKPLNRLLSDWESYSDLLSPLSPSSSSSSHPRGQQWDALQQASYILTQETELKQALSNLEAVQRLEQRGVLDGGRGLTRAIESNRHKLKAVRESEAEAAERVERLNERVIEVVGRWAGYTSTLSQAFTLLDSQLWTLERQLAAMERSW